MSADTKDYSCPSAQPHSEDARVFGVILGDASEPKVAYLQKGVEVSKETVDSLKGVAPTRVFRFAGKCVNEACGQFRNGGCRLGGDVLKGIAPSADGMPACTIRDTCRWFAENGREVCFRCARVVTAVMSDDVVLGAIAKEGLRETTVSA